MVDTNIVIRQWLLTFASITNLLGTNINGSIYCGADIPEHFDPALGGAIQIFTSGGTPDTDITAMVYERKQIRVWCGVEQYDVARAIYGAIRDAIHGQCNVDFGGNGHIVTCNEVTSGQDVTDPDTGWSTVVAFFYVRAHN